MKLNITAKVVDDGAHYAPQNFIMSVGNGRQTFKWLGLAVVQQLKIQAPRGTEFDLFGQNFFVPQDSHILPTNITSHNASFFHPNAMIKDFLCDNADVDVELQEKILLDDYACPKLSLFSRLAWGFYFDEDERDKFEAEAEHIITTETQRRHNSELRIHREKIAPKLACMRGILKGHLVDDDLIHCTAKDDWISIIEGGLLKDVNEEEQEAIFLVVQDHFSLLSDMYKLVFVLSYSACYHSDSLI